MDQPPILGRPKWPGAKPEKPAGDVPATPSQPDNPPQQAAQPGERPEVPAQPPSRMREAAAPDRPATGQSSILIGQSARPGHRPDDGAAAPWQPAPASAPEAPAQRRSLRNLILVTSAVAIAVLAACNGMLLWVYQHSSLGVVITLGTFIAAVALAWLRTRSRQLTAIVLSAQALVALSAVVGVLVALKAGVWTGILAGGITLAGLALLSLIGLLYYTGERKPLTTAVSLGTALAVVASMVGAYAYLSWDYYETTYRAPYVAPPERSVDFLIESGQYYTGDPGQDEADVAGSFERYTCPGSRDEITKLFTDLVEDGRQHLATPEDVRATDKGRSGDTQTATVTATISVIDDFDESVIEGPETWTFHLEKGPSDEYWQVCHIDRPT